MHYPQTWDLDSIFSGGTKSEALKKKLQNVEMALKTCFDLLDQWKQATPSVDHFKKVLAEKETIERNLGQAATFIHMVHDAYTDDAYANVMKGEVMVLYSHLKKLDNRLTKKIVHIDDQDFDALLKDPELSKIQFRLSEIRLDGKRLLSDEEETLIAELNKDGLAAWSDVYSTTVSTMTIPFTDKDGEKKELSIGQAMNRMYADSDPEVRAQLFESWEKAWKKNGPIFADVLNHLAGYRMTLQDKHGYQNHLEEPLEYNRMSKATLDAMWGAIKDNSQPFIDLLAKKKELLGIDKLNWQDVDAPIVVGDTKAQRFTYDEACDFILKHFNSFGDKLTTFTEHAFHNHWIEAEDRDNKRPGGYCTSLPEDDESRIFMTFTGSPSDTSTLAHELGHAFHSHVLKDEPYLNQDYAMNVAETASTFAETIIADATVKNAKSDEEKLMLLNTKLEGATAMFMNIHARFIFENNFYQERKAGVVSYQRLNELMEAAQTEAFGGALDSTHPHFWASKLHFFIDSVPFYNFPYTFGFLFSLGIYAKYLAEPEGFEDIYIALLKDTGAMNVEDLAMKHLNVDLTQPDFWAAGIQLMAEDAQAYIDLANKLHK